MKHKALLISAAILVAVLVSVIAVTAQGPKPPVGPTSALGTGFTYQGQLKKNGSPVNDNTCSMTASLWDAQNGGAPVGGSQTLNTVAVVNGLFTVLLDDGGQFGVGAFDGSARWLQLAVHCTGDVGLVTLTREQLTAAPYALYSVGNWGLNGNGGTAGANFVGTTDNMTLTLGVNGTAALRIVPNATSPNLIGGSVFNTMTAGIAGGTIGGGGVVLGPNSVGGDFGTVGGGLNNAASGNRSTISGGSTNTASGLLGTVGGGGSNTVSDLFATVGGGLGNTASGYAATVPGGLSNSALLSYTLAAGRRAKANHQGAFVWADNNDYDFNSGGDDQFDVRATGGISLVTSINGSGNPTSGVFVDSSGMTSLGGLKAVGAGIGTNTYAFIHLSSTVPNNISGSQTRISNTLTNGDPTAMLLVTHVNNPIAVPSNAIDFAYGVYYDASPGVQQWTIFREDSMAFPAGKSFNVLVIKR